MNAGRVTTSLLLPFLLQQGHEFGDLPRPHCVGEHNLVGQRRGWQRQDLLRALVKENCEFVGVHVVKVGFVLDTRVKARGMGGEGLRSVGNPVASESRRRRSRWVPLAHSAPWCIAVDALLPCEEQTCTAF